MTYRLLVSVEVFAISLISLIKSSSINICCLLAPLQIFVNCSYPISSHSTLLLFSYLIFKAILMFIYYRRVIIIISRTFLFDRIMKEINFIILAPSFMLVTIPSSFANDEPTSSICTFCYLLSITHFRTTPHRYLHFSLAFDSMRSHSQSTRTFLGPDLSPVAHLALLA